MVNEYHKDENCEYEEIVKRIISDADPHHAEGAATVDIIGQTIS